jgi:hypothetical protein
VAIPPNPNDPTQEFMVESARFRARVQAEQRRQAQRDAVDIDLSLERFRRSVREAFDRAREGSDDREVDLQPPADRPGDHDNGNLKSAGSPTQSQHSS